jgi:hypothetical protein
VDRWEVKTETDNRGKPLPVWCWRDYELCENVNMGAEGGWMFELTMRGKRIAVRPNLAEGKKAAREHFDQAHAVPADREVTVGHQLELEAAS